MTLTLKKGLLPGHSKRSAGKVGCPPRPPETTLACSVHPQVAAAFFLTGGIAAALSPSLPAPGAVSRWAYWSAFAGLAGSVAWRLATA